MSIAKVMQLIKDNEVKFVDFRFTDTKGKEQHVSVPISAFDEDKFEEGQAFDGSSIAGWKGIEASDMLLIPDPSTANLDPFTAESTLILSCDVIDPTDGKGYEREAKMAERCQATGLPLVYAHLVGGQDEVVFDGASFALQANGTVAMQAEGFKEKLAFAQMQRAQGAIDFVVHPAHIAPALSAEAQLWGALVLGVVSVIQKMRGDKGNATRAA